MMSKMSAHKILTLHEQMTGAARSYVQLMLDLVAARRIAGGVLIQVEEASRAIELDEEWARMTDDEQEQVEAMFAAACGDNA